MVLITSPEYTTTALQKPHGSWWIFGNFDCRCWAGIFTRTDQQAFGTWNVATDLVGVFLPILISKEDGSIYLGGTAVHAHGLALEHPAVPLMTS